MLDHGPHLTLRNLTATSAAWFHDVHGAVRDDRLEMIVAGICVGQQVQLTTDHPTDLRAGIQQGDVGVVERVSQAHVDVLFARTGQTVVCLASQLEVCDG